MKLALKITLPLLALFVSAAASADSLDFSITMSGPSNPVTFNVFSFSTGVANNSGFTTTGIKLGKGITSPLSVSKLVDVNTGSLQAACFNATLFNTVELRGVDHLTQDLEIDIVLTKVFITSDQLSGATGGDLADESISFVANKITVNGVQVNVTTVAGVQKANKLIAEILHKANSKTVLK